MTQREEKIYTPLWNQMEEWRKEMNPVIKFFLYVAAYILLFALSVVALAFVPSMNEHPLASMALATLLPAVLLFLFARLKK